MKQTILTRHRVGNIETWLKGHEDRVKLFAEVVSSFLLQCMKVKSESEVAQSYPTLSDPMDCSPPGSSINGIFQARVLEWGAIAFSIQSPYSLLMTP